ncbi:hypothetical protein AVEN_126206-1 [Araneus ventricosus]|uniref:Uncharacterized protein n=1 Tax=Araneus ventricosus TaxID=182803 RepID=A0A4Y2IT77_ARAVE|nr:hypothetical protein AVEN_126206-1 [Araneus ventricosus]
MLRHDISVEFFDFFGAFLFKIVIVGCSLSENGTLGRPEAVLGDIGTGYQNTGLSCSKRDCPVQNGTVLFKTRLSCSKRDCPVQNETVLFKTGHSVQNGNVLFKTGLFRSKRDA